MPTALKEVLDEAIKRLVNSNSAKIDAEILLAHILGKSRTYLYTWPDLQLAPKAIADYRQIIEEREKGRPVAHLTGQKEFWNQTLKVTQESLIPRPDTELLVEMALERIPINEELSVADFGTGTGAISIAIASERPYCNIVATDIVFPNLLLAKENASLNRATNIGHICASWCSAFTKNVFDIIVSNPPYIGENDPHLDKGDVRFESHIALFSGTDGLNDIKKITGSASRILKSGGWLLIEHGFGQAELIQEIFSKSGFTDITTYKDLNNHPRVTEGRI